MIDVAYCCLGLRR